MLHNAFAYSLILLYPLTLLAAFCRLPASFFLGLLCLAILYITDSLSLTGLVISILLVLLGYLSYGNQKAPGFPLLALLIAISGLLLAFHIFPGFERIVLEPGITFSENSPAFTLGISTDKALAAGLFLLSGVAYSKIARPNVKELLIFTAGISVTVISLAWITGFVKWDPKLHSAMLIQAYINLFVVCVLEESFFRGIIQYRLARWLKPKTQYALPIAIGIASLLFAIAHFGLGTTYVLLAVIAGLGYGWIYARRQNLLESILVHFSFNMIHMLCFTYPPVQL